MTKITPDFDRTATGYRWLDRLTAPYWRRRSRTASRKLEKTTVEPHEAVQTPANQCINCIAGFHPRCALNWCECCHGHQHVIRMAGEGQIEELHLSRGDCE